MPSGKRILRRESFGGLFVDTASGARTFLRPEEYEAKRQKLLADAEEGRRVTIFDAVEHGYELLPDAASSPTSIFFELTKKCNGHCTNCFMDSNADKWAREEITLAEIEDIIRQFSALGGYYIRLTGGEPSVRPDFLDILDAINDEAIRIGLNTNGLFGPEMLHGILSRGIKDIRVSLDGPEEVNDRIRTPGSYRAVTRTLAGLAEYNAGAAEPVDATINTVLMRSNRHCIKGMIELAQRFGCVVSFGLMRLSGRARREEMLSPEEVVETAHTVHKTRQKLGLAQAAVRINYDIFSDPRSPQGYRPFPYDNSRCTIGGGMTLDCFGRIVPCGYLVDFPRWIGEDVRGKDLYDLWYHSDVLNEARRLTRTGCADCPYHIVQCNGGCPVMAYVSQGSLSGPDPYCVRDVAFCVGPDGELQFGEAGVGSCCGP